MTRVARQPRLIILRGPSGAGKSTVAKALFEQAQKPTVLIGQDYYRFIFKPAGGKINSKIIHKMIVQDVLIALEDGYEVILEGIFNARSYAAIFDEIFAIHKHNNFIFTFDVSFEESLRRHRKKPNKNLWTEEDMKDWYHPKDFMGYDFEHTISEKSSHTQTIETIKSISKI